MIKFFRPRLVVSKCLGFASCRYDGSMIKSSIVNRLKNYADFYPICPEVEVGLPIPRDPIRLVENGKDIDLLQPSTGLNITKKMSEFADDFLGSLPMVDGFILKNKSPSCGIKAVRVYPHGGNSRPRTDGVGAFAREVFHRFYQLPVEDEGRLRNFLIRESFLTRIFTLAEYRNLLKSRDFNDLRDFHTNYKLLLMAHNQVLSREMGRIIAYGKDKSLNELKMEYGSYLLKSISEPASAPSNVNVLQHALGYFSKKLSHDEKKFFLDSVQQYREGKIPLLLCQNLIKSWIIRFDVDYLRQQTFFDPYPQELMEITFI
ncbi:MAG: DUF523 and DUF1722 domain-containing protein [Methanobacteriaceae archaeon]|nr:DUF523 and DUF1722 domain-containing protein [Methanobacteriaceae archaeon]